MESRTDELIRFYAYLSQFRKKGMTATECRTACAKALAEQPTMLRGFWDAFGGEWVLQTELEALRTGKVTPPVVDQAGEAIANPVHRGGVARTVRKINFDPWNTEFQWPAGFRRSLANLTPADAEKIAEFFGKRKNTSSRHERNWRRIRDEMGVDTLAAAYKRLSEQSVKYIMRRCKLEVLPEPQMVAV